MTHTLSEKDKWERLGEIMEVYDVKLCVVDGGFTPKSVEEIVSKFLTDTPSIKYGGVACTDNAIAREELRRILTTLLAEREEEARREEYSKGYNIGKPLLAIEQMREEARREGQKDPRSKMVMNAKNRE